MEWQIITPLAVAVLGGVFALVNSVYQRYQEKVATNRAILAEVSRLIAVIRRHHQWWRERVLKGDLHAPLIIFTTDVYDKLTDKLGQINPKYVGKVVDFYGFVHYLNAVQNTRDKYKPEDLRKFGKFYSEVLESVPRAFAPEFAAAFEKYHVLTPEKQPIVGEHKAADTPMPPMRSSAHATG